MVKTDSLMRDIKSNEKLESIFKHNDPDIIANIIIDEMNKIIKHITPAELIQYKVKEAEYVDEEVKQLRKEAESKIEDAMEHNKDEDWNQY